MAQPISLAKVFPIYKVENDCILSKQGDVTLAFEATLPEIFTLSDQEYEAFHQILIKAIKVLPNNSVFHKQDWFFLKKLFTVIHLPPIVKSTRHNVIYTLHYVKFVLLLIWILIG